MTAQPGRTAPRRTAAIPRTITAIGDALRGEDRSRFYEQALNTEQDDVPAVMGRWWKQAMLDRAPGAEVSRANVAAGRRLTRLEDIARQVERNER
ncbi:hypothetical protein ACTWJ8_40645 (plasmid) [Streptomyces sp. SDT5-1]|uniref:hypothetical protein n=1 Tax=Streptomyces sp. SDT5-1 TaxID=3406418 RepID=UPI003FD4B9DB